MVAAIVIIFVMSESLLQVSIIVPAFREAPNLKPLIERVFSSLYDAGVDGELIIVDDNSQDGTDQIVESLQNDYPIRLIVREDERGLSSAVLRGFEHAQYDYFVVMDADLQHPPEMITSLIKKLEDRSCDFVLGTRYGQGGTIVESWPIMRRLGSKLATLLARPLAPLSDPMSGFFAIPRSTWDRARSRLDPIGYKIGLELYVKGCCRNHEEVPIRFDRRKAGTSKFSLAEQLRYGRHLVKLYQFRFPKFFFVMLLILLGGFFAAVYWFLQEVV